MPRSWNQIKPAPPPSSAAGAMAATNARKRRSSGSTSWTTSAFAAPRGWAARSISCSCSSCSSRRWSCAARHLTSPSWSAQRCSASCSSPRRCKRYLAGVVALRGSTAVWFARRLIFAAGIVLALPGGGELGMSHLHLVRIAVALAFWARCRCGCTGETSPFRRRASEPICDSGCS